MSRFDQGLSRERDRRITGCCECVSYAQRVALDTVQQVKLERSDNVRLWNSELPRETNQDPPHPPAHSEAVKASTAERRRRGEV